MDKISGILLKLAVSLFLVLFLDNEKEEKDKDGFWQRLMVTQMSV